jgi:hypothetical protein
MRLASRLRARLMVASETPVVKWPCMTAAIMHRTHALQS